MVCVNKKGDVSHQQSTGKRKRSLKKEKSVKKRNSGGGQVRKDCDVM